jgi:hypothetical protein
MCLLACLLCLLCCAAAAAVLCCACCAALALASTRAPSSAGGLMLLMLLCIRVSANATECDHGWRVECGAAVGGWSCVPVVDVSPHCLYVARTLAGILLSLSRKHQPPPSQTPPRHQTSDVQTPGPCGGPARARAPFQCSEYQVCFRLGARRPRRPRATSHGLSDKVRAVEGALVLHKLAGRPRTAFYATASRLPPPPSVNVSHLRPAFPKQQSCICCDLCLA